MRLLPINFSPVIRVGSMDWLLSRCGAEQMWFQASSQRVSRSFRCDALEAVAKSCTFSKPFSLKNWTSVHRNHASSTLFSVSFQGCSSSLLFLPNVCRWSGHLMSTCLKFSLYTTALDSNDVPLMVMLLVMSRNRLISNTVWEVVWNYGPS